MMNKDITVLREAVIKLTQMLADMGLTVTQRGTQAYVRTDAKTLRPKIINIPFIPDNADEALILAIQGFIDHEVAHVLFTDWSVVKKADKKGPNLAQLHNLFEDTFIERAMGRKFPGSLHNLDRLHKFFVERISRPALERVKGRVDEEFGVLIVCVARAWSGQKTFREFLDEVDGWSNPLIKTLIEKMPSNLIDRVAKLRSSQDALAVAEIVHDIIFPPPPPKEAAPPPPPAPPPPSPPENNEEEKKEEEEKGESDDSGESDEENEDDKEGKSDSKETSDDDDTSEENESQGEDDKDGGSESDDTDDEASDEDDGEDTDAQDGAEDDQSDEGSGAEGDSEDETSSGDQGDDDDSDGEEGGATADDDETGDDDGDTEEGEADEDSTSSESDGNSGEEDGDDEGESDDADGEEAGSVCGDADAPADDPVEQDEPPDEQPTSKDFAAAEIDLKQSDFEKELARVITDATDREARGADYLIYSSDFDKIVPHKVTAKYEDKWLIDLDDKTRHMIGPMQKNVERMMAARSQVVKIPGYRSGRLHSGSLHRLTAGDDRVFRRLQENKSVETAVTLLIDNSGSMRMSGAMRIAMCAGFALSQTLDRIKIKHEVLGFTTGIIPRSGAGSLREQRAESDRLGRPYSRYEPMYMPIYKGFEERVSSEVKQRFASSYGDADFARSNIDGEAVQVATRRLMCRPERRKVLIVMSDGFPAGMPAVGRELYSDLHRAVADAEKQRVEVIGIGIMSRAVETFYPRHIVLDKLEDLPGGVMNELRRILLS